MIRRTDTMAPRKKSDSGMIAIPVTVLIIAGSMSYMITHHLWGLLALVILFILAIPAITYITTVRTKCLVTFTATGKPCQSPTRGIIFGCRGQNHYWMKALARFGKRYYPANQVLPNKGRQQDAHARLRARGITEEVITVRVQNDFKNSIMIYTTIVASFCTIALAVDQFRPYV